VQTNEEVAIKLVSFLVFFFPDFAVLGDLRFYLGK